MLQLKNIGYSFGDTTVLNDLNMSIADRTFHSLIGLSGAGKTLLLKLISGLLPLQTGSIQSSLQTKGYVFQQADLFPWLTVEKNLQLTCQLPNSEIREELKRFRLEQTANMYPHQLSGGTLKKVSLLRAFLKRDGLILMDEPFAHLDLAQKEEIYSFTLSLAEQYRPTIVLVTHDLDEAIYLSTHISYLSKKDKTIKDHFEVKIDRSLSFHQSKTNDHHVRYYGQIYKKLKGELH